MRVLINIQSNDNECFRWCLVKQVNPTNKYPSKIRHDDRKLAKQLNLKGAKFPFHKNTMQTLKNKIIFPLLCLVLKIIHHAVFIIQNKFLKSMLINYYWLLLKIRIMF